MNYEKSDWAYFGKAIGSCAAVLTLAAGLAMFTSNKPARAETLETKLDTRKAARELARPSLKQIVGEPAESTDVIGSIGSADIYAVGGPIYRKEASPELARLVSEQFNKGDYKTILDDKKGIRKGHIIIEGKKYGFKSVDDRLETLDDYSTYTEYTMPKNKK